MSDSKGAAIRDEILKLFGAYLESGKWTIPPEKVADQILAILAQEVKRADGCPCLLVKPCGVNCTCANGVMSGGCMRCCKYGSMEQRLNAAQSISNRLERLG